MNSAGFYFLVFLLALGAFLIAKRSRERIPPGGGPPETPDGFADVLYYGAKWIAILSFLGFLGSVLLQGLPAVWMERRTQRLQAIKRVERAGGWEVLRQQTQLLLATNAQAEFHVNTRANPNFALPAALASLQSKEITLAMNADSATVLYRLFGMRHSGARAEPKYWLLVVAQGTPASALERVRAQLTRRLTIHEITNGVFEIY